MVWLRWTTRTAWVAQHYFTVWCEEMQMVPINFCVQEQTLHWRDLCGKPGNARGGCMLICYIKFALLAATASTREVLKCPVFVLSVLLMLCSSQHFYFYFLAMIIKEIFTGPIFCIEWKHMTLYNSTSNTYTPTYTHTHRHTHTNTDTHTTYWWQKWPWKRLTG